MAKTKPLTPDQITIGRARDAFREVESATLVLADLLDRVDPKEPMRVESLIFGVRMVVQKLEDIADEAEENGLLEPLT